MADAMQNKVTACPECNGCGTPRLAFKANSFAFVGSVSKKMHEMGVLYLFGMLSWELGFV
jgi:hypothetical protein